MRQDQRISTGITPEDEQLADRVISRGLTAFLVLSGMLLAFLFGASFAMGEPWRPLHVSDPYRDTSGMPDPANVWQKEQILRTGVVPLRLGRNPATACQLVQENGLLLALHYTPGDDFAGNQLLEDDLEDPVKKQFWIDHFRTDWDSFINTRPAGCDPDFLFFDSESNGIKIRPNNDTPARRRRVRRFHNHLVRIAQDDMPAIQIHWWGGPRHPFPEGSEQPQRHNRFATCSLYDAQDINDTVLELIDCMAKAEQMDWKACVPTVSIALDIKPGELLDPRDSYNLGTLIRLSKVPMVWIYPGLGDTARSILPLEAWQPRIEAYECGLKGGLLLEDDGVVTGCFLGTP